MPIFYPAQPSSRISTPGTSYLWTGTGVSASSAVGPETFQVRVITQLAGYITMGTTSDPTIPTTGGVGTYLPVSVGIGEYFKIIPGQKVIFSSTSTTTATAWNMTEVC